MKLEGHAHTWRFPRQAAQGIPTAVNLRALHGLHFLGPEGADSVHLSRRGAGWGGGGWLGLRAHLFGRGGPPAGLPYGSQIPTYPSFGVRSLSVRGGTLITM